MAGSGGCKQRGEWLSTGGGQTNTEESRNYFIPENLKIRGNTACRLVFLCILITHTYCISSTSNCHAKYFLFTFCFLIFVILFCYFSFFGSLYYFVVLYQFSRHFSLILTLHYLRFTFLPLSFFSYCVFSSTSGSLCSFSSSCYPFLSNHFSLTLSLH